MKAAGAVSATFARRPGFSAVVVLTAARGLGAATAIFSAVMSIPWACVSLVLVGLGTVTTVTHAQTIPMAGARIRVTLQSGSDQTIIGTVREITADTVWLSPSGREAGRTIPREHVRRIELSAGRTSHAERGVLIGASVGAVATALFLAVFCADPDTSCGADEVRRAAVNIAVPCAGFGLIVGAIARSERWQGAAWPPGTTGDVRLGVHFRW
jgi:hypothetical protein